MIIEKICDILGVALGSIALLETIRLNKKITIPKVKINLERIDNTNHCSYHNLIIQNISDYNLYDFNLRLEEFENIKAEDQTMKEYIRVLNETIPVFTIGQIYDTFLLSLEENKDLKELNFNVTYKTNPNGKIKKEKITFNINALRNIYVNIK